MAGKIYNVLVLCTGNSARSVMTEVLINTMGRGRFSAYSAGSKPTGSVHPFALEQVQQLGYPIATLRSKSWNEFTQAEAPLMDFVITVCNNAAGEVCPVWPGHPLTTHWDIDDPAAIQGDDAQKRRGFARVFYFLKRRVQQLVDLPLKTPDPLAMKREFDSITSDNIGEF